MSDNHREFLAERIRNVIGAPNDRLDQLVHATGLDPLTDLRFGNWSNLDLSGADLRRYDFSGANLSGANFEGARIDGARFNGANLTNVRGLPKSILAAVEKSTNAVVSHDTDDAIKIEAAQADLRAELERKAWSAPEIDDYIVRLRPTYWLNVDLADKIDHARFIRRGETERVPYRVKFHFNIRRDIVVFTTISPDYPSLLAVITGACYSSGENIVDARIHTTTDGVALDIISIARDPVRDDQEVIRMVRLANNIERRMKDKFLPEIQVGSIETRGALSIRPEVFVDNDTSSEFTVIEVIGPDRPGLLYELTRKMFELNLDIAAAHARTFAQRATDVFYVTGDKRRKLRSSRRRNAIKRTILEVFSPSGGR
jgi:UTP:GlnB (protein PII) uridylyltransferase